MNCKEVREHLLDLAQPTAALNSAAEEHVRGCAACAAELDSLRSTMALLDEWKAPEVSPYFDQRLQGRIREIEAEPQGWLAWLRRPALALVAVALIAVGVALFRTGPTAGPDIASGKPPVVDGVVPNGASAVADLKALDQNEDLYANFELLDESAQQDVTQ